MGGRLASLAASGPTLPSVPDANSQQNEPPDQTIARAGGERTPPIGQDFRAACCLRGARRQHQSPGYRVRFRSAKPTFGGLRACCRDGGGSGLPPPAGRVISPARSCLKIAAAGADSVGTAAGVELNIGAAADVGSAGGTLLSWWQLRVRAGRALGSPRAAVGLQEDRADLRESSGRSGVSVAPRRAMSQMQCLFPSAKTLRT